MAGTMVCFRLPADVHAMVVETVLVQQGLSMSEYMRAIVLQSLGHGMLGVDDGYKQARSLGAHLAHQALKQAAANFPATYEDAMMMFNLADEEPREP